MKNIQYKISLLFPIIIGITLLASCHYSTHDEHEHHHEHEEHNDGIIEITPQQAESIGLATGYIQRQPLSQTIQINGELELAPQNIADVHVLIGGIVDNIRVIEGSRVNKGSILATVSHPDIIKLQEDLISQNAQLVYSENEFSRQEKLYQEKVGSGKEYQKIKSEYEGLKALTDALKAKLKIIGIDPVDVINGKITDKIYVKSPLNGKVSLVETNIGEYVTNNERLFQIVDNSHIHAAFRVYEQDILKVKEGQNIIVTTPSFPQKKFKATVYAISPAFEENPKNVHIHADFETHNDRFISGMYISGKILIDDTIRSIVPKTAVVYQNNDTYIFLKQPDIVSEENHKEMTHEEHEHRHHNEKIHSGKTLAFKKVNVTTGIEEGDWVEITSSTINEEIALTGAYYLIAEMGKAETAHEH